MFTAASNFSFFFFFLTAFRASQQSRLSHGINVTNTTFSRLAALPDNVEVLKLLGRCCGRIPLGIERSTSIAKPNFLTIVLFEHMDDYKFATSIRIADNLELESDFVH